MERLIIYLDINDDDNTGMSAISFVDKPATEVSWNKFNEQKKLKFEKDEMKRIVTGPVMLAETEIYRYSEMLGDYWVKFSAESIFKMRNKYFKEGKINSINEQHNSNKIVENVFLVDSYIIDDKVTSNLYSDLPNGTWMASFYIEDETYWNDVIMSDKFTGFSLEGYFIEKYEETLISEMYSKIENVLNEDISDLEKELKIKNILNI